MTDQRVPTGAEARRERGRQEMRAAIVDAAERIVTEEGTEHLTIRRVANALGYSPGAVYDYYKSKEDILSALYLEGTGGLNVCCAEVVDYDAQHGTEIDIIKNLGRTYRQYALDNPEMYWLTFHGVKTPPPPSETGDPGTPRNSFQMVVDVVRRGVQRGTFADMAPDEVAYAIWSAVHGFVSLEISERITGGEGPGVPVDSPEAGRRQRDRLFESLLDILLNGFVRKDQDITAAT